MRLLPFLYQYGIMWFVLLLGIYFAVKSRQLDLKSKRGKSYFLIMVLGLLGYMILQGFFQFIAPIL